MITVRKLKLTIACDDKELRNQQYQFIRDAQYNQYLGLNKAMTHLASAYMTKDKEVFAQAKKQLTNTAQCFEGIEFGKGIDSKSLISQTVKKHIQADIKNGLAKGERSVRNYKRSYPLMTRGRDLKFTLIDNEIYIKWVNKIIFKVFIGRQDKNKLELEHTLNKVLNGEYKVCTSSIVFKDKDLILNLTLDMPNITDNKIVEGRVLGVDLGIKYPAYVAVNDSKYIRSSMGSIDEFLKVRTQFEKRRRRLQEQLKNVKGGKGRADKLKALDKMRENERAWVKTYNHAISKRIVQFALKNKCETINLELLTKDGFSNKLLRNWSYYELQNMIEYKAERENVKVNYVNPAYTSQTCSECGHVDKENRQTQEVFICTKCGHTINADYNAALNISRLK